MHSRLKVFTKLFSVISDILPILIISKTKQITNYCHRTTKKGIH